MTDTVALVVPSGIDEVPTGGNVYDRRMRDGLAAAGLDVREISVRGAWPRPVPAESAELARSLDALPDGTPVLLDGLVACGVPEVVVPRASRLRLATLVHMPLADDVGLPRTVATELARRERETLAAVAMVVATSEATARRLREEHGVRAVDVVPPGVDPAPPVTGSGAGDRLLCVASVAPVKGQDVLVAALARLADLAWHCRCAGAVRDQAFADLVRDEIERRGLGNRIELTGSHGPEQVARLYDAADLLVLPSRSESYGMVVVEALARGVPVVASAVGGVGEALGDTGRGRPGVLVAPDDPASLADALRTWLTDTAVRQRLRAAALRRRETLEPWTSASRRLAAVLRRLAGTEMAR